MSLSGKEPKGKRPAAEMVEHSSGAAPQASTSEESTGRGKQLLIQQQVNSCEEVGHQEVRHPQVAEGTYSSLSFTELLTDKGKACLEIDKSDDESDEEKSGASISMPNPSSRRGGCQLSNLDLSLLPPREPLELFGASQKTTGQISQTQQNPCPGLRPPWEGVAPVKFSAFRSPTHPNHQYSQLTIFYGGQVNVYNVSGDTAKAIMVLANGDGSTKTTSTAGTPTFSAPLTPMNSTASRTEICRTPSTPCAHQAQPTFTLNPVNLPITRKHSLQRFLEKRNDRLYGRIPYAALHQR